MLEPHRCQRQIKTILKHRHLFGQISSRSITTFASAPSASKHLAVSRDGVHKCNGRQEGQGEESASAGLGGSEERKNREYGFQGSFPKVLLKSAKVRVSPQVLHLVLGSCCFR